jgi:hypothetical protein
MGKIVLNTETVLWGYFTAICEGSVPDDAGMLEKMREIEELNGQRSDGYDWDYIAKLLSDEAITLSYEKIQD